MKMIVQITDCRDCPCNREHVGHGECWSYCAHKDAPTGYKNILYGCREQFEKIPKWCPIQNSK